jgi:hypothetical protein
VHDKDRTWHIEYERIELDGVRLRATLEGFVGPSRVDMNLNLSESWVAFTKSGDPFDYQFVIVSWPDGAEDVAWSLEGRQDSPVSFNRLELGCSGDLGYAALPGMSEEVALLSTADGDEWVPYALLELPAGGVTTGFNPDS